MNTTGKVAGLVLAMAMCSPITSGTAFAGEDTNVKATSIYDFTMKNVDGKDVALSQYKGKVVLIVNVASK